MRIVAVIVLLWSVVARAEEASLDELFEAVHASVVLVRTWEHAVVAQDSLGLIPMSDLGSGVLISEDGDVLTAAHLVQVADVVKVEFVDGTTVDATIMASEPAADLALLRLEQVPPGIVAVPMGDSDEVKIGQEVFVIGAPYGLSHTLTAGHVSARHAPATLSGSFVLGEFFQTDAAVNRGNSGGPMFDMNGEVIGIVSYILSQSGGFEGVGFAVTSNTVQELLLARQSPWSGITFFGLSGMLAKAFNLPQSTGVLVQRVAEGSPGQRLGLRPGFLPARIGKHQLLLGGDVILEIDGIQAGSPATDQQIRQHLAELKRGQTIAVKVLRDGHLLNFSAVLPE